jgi:H/ACA ribonucleoprotein complex subunit 4
MKFDVEREVLVKTEAETNPGYGCDPDERKIGEYLSKGVVNIDKPAGPTSHQVSSWVRDILEMKKAGHSGTLDPNVTGCLPVELEESSKIVRTLLPYGKEYVVVMKLHQDASKKRVRKILKYFKGEMYQRPPLKCAVKRQLRKRSIYYINFLEKDGKYVLFRVGCEAGTYIRKLCHDVGLILGVGAHMKELRRSKAGSFDETSLVNLHELKDAYEFYLENGDEKYLRKLIKPMEKGVQHLKKVWIKDGAISAVCHGANLNAPGVVRLETEIEKGEMVALFSLKNELVALGTALHDSKTIHGLTTGPVVELERVIMDTEVYPRMWRKREGTIPEENKELKNSI